MSKIAFFLFVPTLLLSCSKPSGKTESSEPWGIHEPVIYVQDLATHFKLSDLDGVNRPKTLMTSDTFVFPDGPSAHIRLTATASCSQQDHEGKLQPLVSMTTTRPLPAQSYVFEFLPFEALLQPQQAALDGLVCSLDFQAQNENGSRHEFQLSQFLLRTGTDSFLQLLGPQQNKETGAILLSGEDLGQASVRANQTGDLQLRCLDEKNQMTSDTLPTAGTAVSLNLLHWPTEVLSRPYRCRIFATTPNQGITAMSPLFRYSPAKPALHLTRLGQTAPFVLQFENPKASFGPRNGGVFFQWRASNDGDLPLWIRFGRKEILWNTVRVSGGIRNGTGLKASLKMKLALPGSKQPDAMMIPPHGDIVFSLVSAQICTADDGILLANPDPSASPQLEVAFAQPQDDDDIVLRLTPPMPSNTWFNFSKLKVRPRPSPDVRRWTKKMGCSQYRIQI